MMTNQEDLCLLESTELLCWFQGLGRSNTIFNYSPDQESNGVIFVIRRSDKGCFMYAYRVD